MKNSNDTIWDRTSDLPICSTAQPLCHRGPLNILGCLLLSNVQINFTSQEGWFDIEAFTNAAHASVIYGVCAVDCWDVVQSCPNQVECTLETQRAFLGHKLASC